MKKYIVMASIFLLGFIIGALTMNWLTIPVRKVYREYLQTTYVYQQETLASSALKQGQRLQALVHLWNKIDADPLKGANLFGSEYTKDLEQTFWPFLLPSMNRYLDKIVYVRPEHEDNARGFAHGKLAAVLQILGYEEPANIHWAHAAKLLKLPESEVKTKFIDLIRKIEEGRL